MKIRSSFVTNSSSSSFIIAFDKKPESAEEMKQILFGSQEYFFDPYYDADSQYFNKRPEKYSALEVATIVFNDIKEQSPLSKKAIKSFVSDGGWYHPSDEDVKEFKDKVVYEVEYADDCGNLFCAMERGDLFERIPHRSQSNH